MEEQYLTWIEVDAEIAAHNYRCVRRFVREPCELCIVVKNESYGMGGEVMASLYDSLGADRFATVDSQEALALRKRISQKEILVLGFVFPDHVEPCIRQGITMTVYSLDQARNIGERAQAVGTAANVHIKIDTGLHRLGFLPDEAGLAAIREIADMEWIHISGVYTHFAKAEDPDRSYTHEQIRLFRQALDRLIEAGVSVPMIHASSTRAMVDFPEYNFDMVRPGLIMTGFHYFGNEVRDRLPVQPCIGLKSTLVQVKTIPAGEGVGYGYTYVTQRETVIGVLPLGYAQGYSKAYANSAYVLVGGMQCPVVGNIAMNHFMVDLTDAGPVAAGDEVTIFGLGGDGALTMADAAALRGTNIEEVLSNFVRKLPVKHVNHPALMKI